MKLFGEKMNNDTENMSIEVKLQRGIALEPYEIMISGRFQDNMNIINKCKLIKFSDKPGKIYLALDQNATNHYDCYTKNKGDAVCIEALNEICYFFGIEKVAGYRVARMNHHLEIYEGLLNKITGIAYETHTPKRRVKI